jgi:hypothetical protein
MYVIVTSLVFCISRVSPLISLIIRRPCFVVNVMQVDQRLELLLYASNWNQSAPLA